MELERLINVRYALFSMHENHVSDMTPLTHFIDFEASGISPDAYPIEVAVVWPTGEYQVLIKPARYWDHWSYDAQDMHGLTREALEAGGSEPLAVATEMNRLFGGLSLCSDNPADVFWLDVLFEAAGIDPMFQVLPLESLLGRELASEIVRNLPVKKGHRALADAKALAIAYGRVTRSAK